MWRNRFGPLDVTGDTPVALHITEMTTVMPASRGPSDLDATWWER